MPCIGRFGLAMRPAGLGRWTWVVALALCALATTALAVPVVGLPRDATLFDLSQTHSDAGEGPLVHRFAADAAASLFPDEDPWAVLNGHLAEDPGGVHPLLARTIEVDALASTPDLQVDDEVEPSFAVPGARGSRPMLAMPAPSDLPEPGTIALVMVALALSVYPARRAAV